MTQLSLEAQAVLGAFLSEWPDEALEQDRKCIAAALCAAADQVVSKKTAFLSPGTAAGIRADLLAIATELEGQ
jgi:hypothetical protein